MQKTILLIDDEEAIVMVTQATLEILAGWKVLTASSGAEGIKAAAAHRPDAILLDVMMPEIDGLQTLTSLRNAAETATIPVIFLTAKVQAADIRRFCDLGARGVIAKPFDPLRLSDEIGAILGWAAHARQTAPREG